MPPLPPTELRSMPGPSVFCYYLYCTIAAERRTRYDCHSWYTRIIIYNSRGRKSEFMYPPLQPSSTIIHARVIRTEYAICGKAHSKSAPLLSPRLLRLIIKYIKPRIHKGSYSTVQSLSSNDPLCEWVAVICIGLGSCSQLYILRSPSYVFC